MVRMTVAQAREGFSELCGRVAYGNERVTLTRFGKPVAVIMSVADIELFETLLKRYDVEVSQAIAERTDESEMTPLDALLNEYSQK